MTAVSSQSIHLHKLCSVPGADLPETLVYAGKLALLEQPSLALFCSARAPAGVILRVHDWAQRWRQQGPLIVSGFHSPTEAEAFTVLLRGPRPVVQVLARSMLGRLPAPMRTAIDEERLLLLSPFPAAVKRITASTAQQRNRIVAALADAVLIAHAGPGSKSEQLAREILSWGKPVWTVDHPANGHLIEMGIEAYKIGNPSELS